MIEVAVAYISNTVTIGIQLNVPASIGLPLHGVRVRTDENDELLAKGPSVMLGYWKDEEATRQMIDADGWLQEIPLIEDYYRQFGDRVPEEFFGQLHGLKQRLNASKA